MKMILIKKILIAVLIVSLPIAAHALPLVTFEPLKSVVDINDTFSVDIVGRNFPDPMLGGGVNLSFAPAFLQVNSVTIDPVWNFVSQPGTIDNTSGLVTDILFTSFPPVAAGDFTIATVEFLSIGNGTSNLVLADSTTPNPFVSINGPVDVKYVSGSVAPVPEPATLVLISVGLFGLAGAGLKKKFRNR